MSCFISLLLLIFFGCQNVPTNAPDKHAIPYVVMISLDGYRYDYTQKYRPPHLTRIQKQGLSTEGLIPVYPSLTFPNHYSIVTGLYPENHNLISNEFYDRKTGKIYSLRDRKEVQDGSWYGGTPLWNAIKQAGVVTASYFWVGSDANIQGSYPDYYYNFDPRVDWERKVNQVIDWLTLPPATRPHLITLYFGDVDSAGHRYGPESEQVKQAVHQVDHAIGVLMQKIEKLNLPVNFIIVSDHGMRAVSPEKNYYLSDYISLADMTITGRGSSLQIYLHDPKKLPKLEQALKRIPMVQVHTRENLPLKWHYSRSDKLGNLILTAEAGAYLHKVRVPGKKPKSGATHGYTPDDPLMQGIFYAHGPGIRSGKIPAFENVHIFPFVMKLLNLSYSFKIDGDPQVLDKYVK